MTRVIGFSWKTLSRIRRKYDPSKSRELFGQIQRHSPQTFSLQAHSIQKNIVFLPDLPVFQIILSKNLKFIVVYICPFVILDRLLIYIFILSLLCFYFYSTSSIFSHFLINGSHSSFFVSEQLNNTCLAFTLAKDSAYFPAPTIDCFLLPVSLHIRANNHGISFLSFLPQHSIQNLLQIHFVPSILPPYSSCMCHYIFLLAFQATYLCLCFFSGSQINLNVPVENRTNISN